MRFLPPGHPATRINTQLATQIERAQQNLLEQQFTDAAALLARAADDCRLSITPPGETGNHHAAWLGEMPPKEFSGFLADWLGGAGLPKHLIVHQVAALGERIRLLTAFDEPDVVVDSVVRKVMRIIEDFPRSAADIQCGRNPGDVLDPFILAATQGLLFGGDFEPAIEATVAHKAMMIIEGMLGHLHEDVIGQMRGNVRVPEPRGEDQETLSPEYNPFPGADILQPPYAEGDCFKFHQIKSKTGSAKGGDGRRLGEQLDRLRGLYGGEIYYHALIGNTLRGHRSKAGVEKAAEGIVVLVGQSSFRVLTRTTNGPELLLRLYQAAFTTAANRSGYRVEAMTADIVAHFAQRAQAEGESFLEVILQDATAGPEVEQDNRFFNVSRTGRTRR